MPKKEAATKLKTKANEQQVDCALYPNAIDCKNSWNNDKYCQNCIFYATYIELDLMATCLERCYKIEQWIWKKSLKVMFCEEQNSDRKFCEVYQSCELLAGNCQNKAVDPI